MAESTYVDDRYDRAVPSGPAPADRILHPGER